VKAVVVTAVAPVIPDAVQANPYWRPGLGPNEPWMVMIESTVGRLHTPCNVNSEHAHSVLRKAESLAALGADFLRPGVITLGGAVVAPDGSIAASWGKYADPFGEPLYRPLAKVGGGAANWGWEQCRSCGGWLWPGRWVVAESRQCGSCAKAEDDGRPWPVDPPAPGGRSEPPPPPPKKKAAKKDGLALD
jgi:hypothetical protein